MKTWIIVAHRTEAKIFSYDHRKNADIEFVTKLENPRGRLKAQDINADRPGIFSGAPAHASGLQRQESPTERVAQEFAKKISDYLELSRQRHIFTELILIADPYFLGLLRGNLTKPLIACVRREISKDLATVTGDDLKNRLWPQEPERSRQQL
ncbi:MAG: host attachment protein [Bdellovibrio sp.]|nr:host attachment protein [Bdellovibrio sp.]